MKVIKKGRKQKGWSKEFKCTGDGNGGGGCGALLLVEQADVYTTESHCRDECDTYHTFQCSSCGVETDIKEHVPFSAPSKAKWLARRGKEVEDHYNK
jgi:hypothetical protein